VTEFGCGPGTFLWAFLFYLRARRPQAFKKKLRLLGIDASAAALELGRRIAGAFAGEPGFDRHQIEFAEGTQADLPDDPAQFLIIGNVLTETPDIDAAALHARDLLVIEPGTCDVFHRCILPLRDQLTAQGWTIEFPCPSRHACPMAADNWCHFNVNRFVLPFIQRMSAKAGRLNPRHHFCGFYFSKRPADSTPARWRVLSRLRRVHRSGIRWLCDGEHLVEAVLNRRAKAEHNRAFLDADAGDALELELQTDREAFCAKPRFSPADRVTPASP
jgi:hypothetical protein